MNKFQKTFNPITIEEFCQRTADSNPIHDRNLYGEQTIVSGRLIEAFGLQSMDLEGPFEIDTVLHDLVRINEFLTYEMTCDGFTAGNENDVLETRISSIEEISDVNTLEPVLIYDSKQGNHKSVIFENEEMYVPLTFLVGKSSHAIIKYIADDEVMNSLPDSQVYIYGKMKTSVMPAALEVMPGKKLYWQVKRTSPDKMKFTPELRIDAYKSDGLLYRTEIRLSRAKKSKLFK